MIRSPFPDVEIPDVSFTDFVLAGAVERSDKPALIDASSGRTVTHAELAQSVRALAAGPAGRGFGHGLVVLMNMPLYRGATVVTMPQFDLGEFLRVVQDYRITRAWVVPPIVLALAKHPLVHEFDLSSLQFVLSGAAPLSAELEVACGRRLGCRMLQGYGLTETSPTTHSVPDELAGQMPGAIGPPIPNTECQIVDLATGQNAPDGEPGELCIRGPQVMKGYLNQPEATARTIDPDGWLHTGDVARIETDGSLRIVDRVKELIKYKGYQIAPAELEGLLLTHPAVADAAVIPVPDEQAGEIPKLRRSSCPADRSHPNR